MKNVIKKSLIWLLKAAVLVTLFVVAAVFGIATFWSTNNPTPSKFLPLFKEEGSSWEFYTDAAGTEFPDLLKDFTSPIVEVTYGFQDVVFAGLFEVGDPELTLRNISSFGGKETISESLFYEPMMCGKGGGDLLTSWSINENSQSSFHNFCSQITEKKVYEWNDYEFFNGNSNIDIRHLKGTNYFQINLCLRCY